jgi:hypothetical protein
VAADLHPNVARRQRWPPLISQRRFPRPRPSHDGAAEETLDLSFPHVKQVFLVERTVTDTHGSPLSNLAILGVTSLSAARGTPALIAGAVRGQWKIEVLHWIRDAIYREDDSKARTKSGPRVMATFRNLSIGALRLYGRDDIAEPSAGPPATRNDHSLFSESPHDPRS